MAGAIGLREAVRRIGAWDTGVLKGSHLAERPLRSSFFGASALTRGPLTVEAARRLNLSASVLAGAAWLENAQEYSEEAYRAERAERSRLVPFWGATLALLANLRGASDKRRASSALRGLALLVAGLAGMPAIGWPKRPALKTADGDTRPVLEPAGLSGRPSLALSLSGLLGLLAERLRNTAAHKAPTVLGLHAGRVVGLASAAALIGASGEAGGQPFRRLFRKPFRSVPLLLPPVTAVLVAQASFAPQARPHTAAHLSLWATAGVSMLAAGLRARQDGRAAESRAPRQGLTRALAAIPVPPRSTAFALAGLAALILLKDVSYARFPRRAPEPFLAGPRS